MSQPAARITDMHACPMQTPGVPPVPHVGGPILAKDWEPIVRSVTDAEGNSFLMPMFVGRVGGQ